MIQFQCGFCRTTLTVPAQMAGVSGPCPSCGQTIISPAAVSAAQPPPQPWTQAPAASPAPAWPSTPPQPLPSAPDLSGISTAPGGLPPKRLTGQPPALSALAGPTGNTNSGALQNVSRLIPGSPALPKMSAGVSGGMGVPSPSLLGREAPPAPVTPMTQPLHTGGIPALNLGGDTMPPSPVAAIPAGRSIASLRTPRGTNYLRLAFAAVFLLGFLGLFGFLLKDHLSAIFPSLAVHDDDTEELMSKEQAPAPILGTDEKKSSEPLLYDNGSLQAKSPEAVPASPAPAAVASSGFDPTEPVTVKTAPVLSETAMSDVAISKPVIATVKTPLPPSDATGAPTAAAGALMEVPAKPAMNSASALSPSATPTSITKTHVTDDSDVPQDAKPAVAALKKFLSAGTLTERLQQTLGAEHMQPLMERYYTRAADGPVFVDRIQFVRMDPNPEVGSGRHCIFSLENKTWEYPVPVMLEEQTDGFKVDWLAFVEFKDRLLEKFFQNYQEGPVPFHVGILRQHYFEDGVPDIEHKDAFRVMPAPPNSFQAPVFLDKDTALAQELRTRLPWETHVWAVVMLEWKKLGSQQWVELSAVPQMHWYTLPVASKPAGASSGAARAVSTPQKTSEPEMPPGISKNGVGGKTSKNTPPPGIRKSTPELPTTIKRPLPAGR